MTDKRTSRMGNRRAIVSSLLAAAGLSVASGAANAENRALLMTIADYSGNNALPAVKYDAESARKIATAMGVPSGKITALADRQLTLTGIRQALASLADSTQQGDNVFIYYSGHGGQIDKPGEPGKCREGLVPIDIDSGASLLFDDELEQLFSRIAQKAARVVVMNDSCFSGGAATKSVVGARVKRWDKSTDRQCGDPVNKALTRAMSKSVSNMAYLAASSENEVSLILRDGSGSTGTRAWEQCLGTSADRDRSGAVTAQELTTCAREKIASWTQTGQTPKPQTPTVVGNGGLPLAFVASANPSESAQATNPRATFRDLINSRSGSIRVSLTSGNPTMRIGQDSLDLTVSTDKPGYLTLFYLGSDGQTIDVLFPNDLDSNDYIQPGTHKLPRSNWRLKAGGPAGTNQVVAFVSAEKKDFKKYTVKKGAFSSAKSTALFSRNLLVEATGGAGDCKNLTPVGCGVFGASEILEVREVQ